MDEEALGSATREQEQAQGGVNLESAASPLWPLASTECL